MVERVTGFAPTPNVREDTDPSPQTVPVSSPATCDCNPDRDVFCDEAGELTLLIRRGERIVHQYGDHLPLNLAVGDLADHLRVDRASVLTGIETLHRGSPDVRSQTRVP